MFYPAGPVPDGFKSGFVITAMIIRGSRAEHYRAVLSGIPYIQKQPDPDSTVPVVMIVFLYVIAVAMGLAIRALTA